ncbi:hypothetical protein I79_012102 [Cricetulus griseus]|uniref:Uncharacterized protein n=1 Tax=Cricetulus griseus TaxID=10029 RepID=G3HMX3_CRIGR|nr:hypothetical protein I79_012102 [Cricetulus griseus]
MGLVLVLRSGRRDNIQMCLGDVWDSGVSHTQLLTAQQGSGMEGLNMDVTREQEAGYCQPGL